MAARSRKKKKAGAGTTLGAARAGASKAQTRLVDNVQQIWLAGMGAVSRAQQEGPAAFQEAVAEGLALLNRSRSSAEKLIRDVFESAQESVQSRIECAGPGERDLGQPRGTVPGTRPESPAAARRAESGRDPAPHEAGRGPE